MITFQRHWISLPLEAISIRRRGLTKAARPSLDLRRGSFIEPINNVVTGIDEPFDAVHDAAFCLPIQSGTGGSLNTCVPTFLSQ